MKQVFREWRQMRWLVETVAQPILWWHFLYVIYLKLNELRTVFMTTMIRHFILLNMSITIQR